MMAGQPRVSQAMQSRWVSRSRRANKERGRWLCFGCCRTRFGDWAAGFNDRTVFDLMRLLSQRASTDLGDVKCTVTSEDE
jgi:hypothetical protein